MNRNTKDELTTSAPLLPSECYKQPFRVLNCYAGIGGNRKLWNGKDMFILATVISIAGNGYGKCVRQFYFINF